MSKRPQSKPDWNEKGKNTSPKRGSKYFKVVQRNFKVHSFKLQNSKFKLTSNFLIEWIKLNEKMN